MKEILITTNGNNMRAAIFEEGRLVELMDDMSRDFRLSGSIFKGRVENIVPGMQAAFVDIGLERNAFLYAGDLIPPNTLEQSEQLPPIEGLLREGQEIVVQITREPVGEKGARVAANITLPGRFVVLLPKNDYIGISRKIDDEEEKVRLKKVAQEAKPKGSGLIVRTMAQGVAEKELIQDVAKLTDLAEEIDEKARETTLPSMIYSSNDPFSRLLRETIDENVDKIIIDDLNMGEFLKRQLKELACSAWERVQVDLQGELFSRYQVEEEVRKALKPRVWLKSGGYLVIEKTEALTVIDVNTGKYTGKKSVDNTLLQLNKEAAKEIARQIRLRNLTGIIIIDFIDMNEKENWKEVLADLEDYCRKDKAKWRLFGRTSLNLVELTRKKEGQPLAVRYTKTCPQCGGKGWLTENN